MLRLRRSLPDCSVGWGSNRPLRRTVEGANGLNFVTDQEFLIKCSTVEGNKVSDLLQRDFERSRDTEARFGSVLASVLSENEQIEAAYITAMAKGSGSPGRTPADAPEVDGVVRISDADLRVGDLITARITRAFDYDLGGIVALS